MIRHILFIPFFLCLFTTFCISSDIRDIQWEDLVPKLPPEDNPLAGYSEEEAGLIEYFIYLREYLPPEATAENQQYYDELNQALPELKKKGIDVDKIIADRKYRNSAVNSELDGKEIRIAAYMLPLDLSGSAVTEFLLVPYVGACIHTPPPPPNQIVHAVSDTPTPYEMEALFKPVSVTGRLKVKSLSKELFLSDGSSNIDVGYSMSVDKIEDYKP